MQCVSLTMHSAACKVDVQWLFQQKRATAEVEAQAHAAALRHGGCRIAEDEPEQVMRSRPQPGRRKLMCRHIYTYLMSMHMCEHTDVSQNRIARAQNTLSALHRKVCATPHRCASFNDCATSNRSAMLILSTSD
jgi:hypothetical protein